MATYNITNDGVYAGSVDADNGAQALRIWAMQNNVTICEQPPLIDEGMEYGAHGKGTYLKGRPFDLEASPEPSPEREPDPDAVLIDGMWYHHPTVVVALRLHAALVKLFENEDAELSGGDLIEAIGLTLTPDRQEWGFAQLAELAEVDDEDDDDE